MPKTLYSVFPYSLVFFSIDNNMMLVIRDTDRNSDNFASVKFASLKAKFT